MTAEVALHYKRITDENGIKDYTLPVLAGYELSEDGIMERAAHGETAVSQLKNLGESYISPIVTQGLT